MNRKIFLIGLIFTLSVSTAGKFDQASINRLEATNTNAPVVPSSTPNSSVVLDFGLAVGESWDAQDDPDNVIASCVSGGSITGFEWTNVTIETVGASWLSEATLLFSDTGVTNGINLTIGNGDDMAGTMTYSSGGIIDLTDNALPDITPGMDGNFIMQIYESFDDTADAIDANFTAGTVTVYGIDLVGTSGPNCAFVAGPPAIIPATNWYWLVGLFLMLTLFSRKFIKS